MTDDLIIQKAIEEIETKSLGVTEQFLEVHEIEYADGKPVVARVDKEKGDGVVIVYFPVKGFSFYFAVYLDTVPEIAIRRTGTEPDNHVYFRATSEVLDFKQLAALTKLPTSGGWNIGDKRRPGGTLEWKNSKVEFKPNPEPDEFEDKLKKLLDFLEQDREGVKQLVDKAGGYIQVAIEFHDGNGMLGGPHIDKEYIKRMALLDLEIDLDLYATGNGFK